MHSDMTTRRAISTSWGINITIKKENSMGIGHVLAVRKAILVKQVVNVLNLGYVDKTIRPIMFAGHVKNNISGRVSNMKTLATKYAGEGREEMTLANYN